MRWIAALLPLLCAGASHAGARQSNPAFLGIGFGNGPGGCVIATVTPGAPAAEAGIEPDDVILAFDRIPLDRTQPCDQLVASITTHASGDRVQIDVLRNMVHKELVATLATRAEVVQKRVGHRIGTTDLVDVDDPRRHYDLEDRGRTVVVGWFLDRCTGCARVFDKIADGLKDRAKSDVFVLAVRPRDFRDDDLSGLRKSFNSPVALAVADNDTFDALAMSDQDRAFFMVIDCKGIVRLVTPIAPDADDLDAAVDEVLAGAIQAEHARTRR